jgi:hypothetical protein
MGSKLPHRIFIILGITCIAFAGFLPIGYSVIDIKGENNFGDFITKPSFGITHSVYYLNFILLTIPLICGYHGRRFVAQLLVILFIMVAVITTFIGCTFIGFNWGGPIHGSTGLGMSAMIAGDIFLLIGCLLQIAYNKKQIQD